MRDGPHLILSCLGTKNWPQAILIKHPNLHTLNDFPERRTVKENSVISTTVVLAAIVHNMSYRYTPLPVDVIRLAEILPALSQDKLQMRFFTASLEDAPHYTYLSYVWGNPGMSQSISCDGTELVITTNLSDALHVLRRHHRVSTYSELFWIDQICINQADIQERTQQVVLMPQIIRGAAQTILVRKHLFSESDAFLPSQSSAISVTKSLSHYSFKAS